MQTSIAPIASMRLLACALLACIALISSVTFAAETTPDHACRPTPPHTFDDLVQFVRKEGVPNKLPARYAEALKLGKDDIPVTRLAGRNVETKIFRSFDLPAGSPDYILFVVDGGLFHFWRLTPKAQTVLSVRARRDGPVEIVRNSELASELTALCAWFFDLDYFTKGKKN
jgi:hypothetical protein